MADTNKTCFRSFAQKSATGIPEILNAHVAEFIEEEPPGLEGSPT